MASKEQYLKCLISFQEEVIEQISSNQYDEKSYFGDLQKMTNYIKTISKPNYDERFDTVDTATRNLLNSVCLNYLYIVIRFYSRKTSKNYLSRCCEFLEVLLLIIQNAPDKNKLVEKIGKALFQFLHEKCVPDPVKNEIIKYFNIMLSEFKSNYSDEDFLSHLCKLMDYVSICGDYDIQESSIELILRICPRTNEIETAKQFFPESEDFAQSLTLIHKDEKFEENARRFLNILNKSYENVISLTAHEVLLEQKRTIPHQSLSDIWVDFNFGSQSIGIHCSSKTFSQNPEESEEEFEVIKIKEEQIESIDVSFNKTATSNNCKIAIKLLESVTTRLKSSKKFADSVKLLKILFVQVPDGCNLNEYFSTLFPEKYTLKELSSNDYHDSSNTGLLESNMMKTIFNISQKPIPGVSKDDSCSDKEKRQLGFKSGLNYSMINNIGTYKKNNQSEIISLHSSPGNGEDNLCSSKDKRQLGFKSRLDYSRMVNKIETEKKSNQSNIFSLHSSPDDSEDDLCSNKIQRQLGFKSRLDYSMFNNIGTYKESNEKNIVPLCSSPASSTHLKSPASESANSIGSSMKNNVGGTYGISNSISKNLLNKNTFENSQKPNDNENITSVPQMFKLSQEFDDLNKENIQKLTRNTKPKNLNKVKRKREKRKRADNSELESLDILAKSKQNNIDLVEKRDDNYVQEYKETNIKSGIQDNWSSNPDQPKKNKKLTKKAKNKSKLLLNKQLSSLSCIGSEIISQESQKKFASDIISNNRNDTLINSQTELKSHSVSIDKEKIVSNSNRNKNVLTKLTKNTLKLGLKEKKIDSSQKNFDWKAITNISNDNSQNEFKSYSLSVADDEINSNKNENVSTTSSKNTRKLGLTKKTMKAKKNNSKLKDLNGKDHNNSSNEVEVIKPKEFGRFKPQSLLKLEKCPSEKRMLQDIVKSRKKHPVKILENVLISDGRSIKKSNVSKGNISSTSKKRKLNLLTDNDPYSSDNSDHKTSVITEPKISLSQVISAEKVLDEPQSNLISIDDISTIPGITSCDNKYNSFENEMRSKRKHPVQTLESTNLASNNNSFDNTERTQGQGINDCLNKSNEGSPWTNFKQSKSNHIVDDVQDDSDHVDDESDFPISKMIQKKKKYDLEDNVDDNSSDDGTIKSKDSPLEERMLEDNAKSTSNNSVEVPRNILIHDGKSSNSALNDNINLITYKRRFIPLTDIDTYSSNSNINTNKPNPSYFPDKFTNEDINEPQSNIISVNQPQNVGSTSTSSDYRYSKEERAQALNDYLQKSNEAYKRIVRGLKVQKEARKNLWDYYKTHSWRATEEPQ